MPLPCGAAPLRSQGAIQRRAAGAPGDGRTDEQQQQMKQQRRDGDGDEGGGGGGCSGGDGDGGSGSGGDGGSGDVGRRRQARPRASLHVLYNCTHYGLENTTPACRGAT